MNIDAGAIAAIEMEALAKPKDGETVDQLVERMKELGNEIIEIRPDGVVIGFYREEF